MATLMPIIVARIDAWAHPHGPISYSATNEIGCVCPSGFRATVRADTLERTIQAWEEHVSQWDSRVSAADAEYGK